MVAARAKIAFEQAAHRREEIVQDVAHDLRTPLTSIKGATQNLLDDMAGSLSESTRESRSVFNIGTGDRDL